MSQLATATRLYYNYTGESKCLNITTPETKDLGDEGWDYQVGPKYEYFVMGFRQVCLILLLVRLQGKK